MMSFHVYTQDLPYIIHMYILPGYERVSKNRIVDLKSGLCFREGKIECVPEFSLIFRYVPTTSSSSTSGYRYGTYGSCPRHPHGGCSCTSMYSHPAHPAHPTHPHQHALDHFVRPPPPADPADIMQTGKNIIMYFRKKLTQFLSLNRYDQSTMAQFPYNM